MSLFNRKPIEILQKKDQTDFHIPQFIKIEGLKKEGLKKFKTTEFISPIFGMSVKDETVAPFISRNTGDIRKRYDAFRNKPMTDLGDYAEFKSIIVKNQDRKKIFGEDAIVDTSRKYEDPRTKEVEIEVPFVKKKPIESFVELPKETYIHEQEKIVVSEFEYPVKEPVLEDKIDTISRTNHLFERFETNDNPIIDDQFQYVKQPDKPEVETLTKKEIQRPQTEKPKPIFKKENKYVYPSPSLFSKVHRDQDSRPEWLIKQEEVVNETLLQFNVPGKVKNITKGPTVTRHEIELEPGVNVKEVGRIKDNLMMNLSAKSLRIEAPIPGKPYVGLEIPNVIPEMVAFGNVVDDKEFLDDADHPLKIALGVDIDGHNIYADIAKMPHGLIAGATNSGKSVCVNTIIVSLLMKNSPDDVKFILIDPKMVELTLYNDLPHLVTPVINDPKMASTALSWAVEEMDRRFMTFSQNRVKDIKGFNEKVKMDQSLTKMPYIIIVIDELADLMMVSANDVEEAIQRLTQKARAAGIHVLVATQRPTTDVVKGTIKANIPTRIAFRVASYVDSNVILDGAGAETLLGKGDMLLKEAERPVRLQGAFVRDSEIEKITDFIRAQMGPDYLFDHESLRTYSVKKESAASDDLMYPVAQFVVRENSASINSIQKEFSIGFNRAQRIVELLEEMNIVSKNEGTKPRQVLVTMAELENMI
ncbi:MAG: DNA translocase FtsK [Acholeplasma sp.]|nr:DNA translocase FtsK [Acholeplasma sp.]